MNLIGFNINKVSAEKFSSNFKELKIENNITIEDIQATKSDLFKKDEEALQVKFVYNLDYSPDLARISFAGSVILLVDQKDSKNILKLWEDKKVSDGLKLSLFNTILRKTSIKALELEDELNLPLHISFPYLRPKQENKD